MTVDQYIKNVNEALKPIVKKLRSVILQCSPELTESIKWNVPIYTLTRNICSIMVHKNHVNLQLFKAGLLDDTSAFEGTGKEMRHIKYKTLEAIDETQVKAFILQLMKLDKKG